MSNYNEEIAKEIVNVGLSNWKGTLSSLEKSIKELLAKKPKIKSKTHREEIINKKFKSQNYFFHRYINAPYSMDYVLLQKGEGPDIESRNEKKRSQETQDVMNRHLHKLNSNKLNVFVVLDDTIPHSKKLVICIFNPHVRDGDKILLTDFYSVAHITKHCLERIILRLKVVSIEEALDEILTSTLQLEQSCKELQVRVNVDSINLKRHIPTRNGALLFKVETEKVDDGKPILNGNLITWIHKKQFFKGQEVYVKDFNFVQIINYFLNDPKPQELIESWKNGRNNIDENNNSKFYFLINQFEYDFDDLVSTLEEGKYLDIMVDFERSI